MPVYETAGVVSVFSLATGVLDVPAGFAASSVATVGVLRGLVLQEVAVEAGCRG